MIEHDDPQRITEPAPPPQAPPLPRLSDTRRPSGRLMVAAMYLEQLDRWPGVTDAERSEARLALAIQLAELEGAGARPVSYYLDQLRGEVHR